MAQTWKMRSVYLGVSDVGRNTAAGTKVYFPQMLNCEKAINVVFFLNSALDVPVTAQLVGSETDSPKDAFLHYRIGDCFNLPAGFMNPKRISVPVDLLQGDAWHPYLGIECTTMRISGQTASIILTAYVRENLDVNERGEVTQQYEVGLPAQEIYKVVQPDAGRATAPATIAPAPRVLPRPATRYLSIFGGRGL